MTLACGCARHVALLDSLVHGHGLILHREEAAFISGSSLAHRAGRPYPADSFSTGCTHQPGLKVTGGKMFHFLVNAMLISEYKHLLFYCITLT